MDAAVIAGVLAAALGLAAAQDPGTGSRREPPAEPPPTIEHVTVAAGGGEQSGWLLDPATDAGFALLADDGTIVLLKKEPRPKVVAETVVPVAGIPSAALATGLGHAEARVRERCEELLLDQGAPALPSVADALAAPSPEARRLALAILAAQAEKHAKAAQPLRGRVAKCANDADPKVRRAALEAYAALGGKNLFELCATALQFDDSPLVRHEAIIRLGRTKNPRAIEVLLEHLDGCEEESLRRITFDALRRLSGCNLGRDEDAWRAWWTNRREVLLREDD